MARQDLSPKRPQPAVYRFGSHTLDLMRGVLRGAGGGEVGLRPKAAEVLRHLVERAGRVVSRDELMDAVWPDVVVTDDSLTQCVFEVRRALGGEGARLLRTLPRRGYLLDAEVAPADPPPAPAIPPGGEAVSPHARPSPEEARPLPPDTPPQPDAERRQLTLLSCGLAGSAVLAARLDPEDLRAVIRAYHRAVGAAVEVQGGAVAQLLSDGLLACFGWPRAHEDDAERAVRAGLTVAEAVAGLHMPQAGPLRARVGVATGPVVVGGVLGEDGAREQGVLGETLGLAARLRDAAEPGAVAVDAATRRLTGALFEWADLGEVAPERFPGPVRAWRALGRSAMESRFEALRSAGATLPPLVGREEELGLLLRRWRRARAGDGRVVLLRGEPGIGKSRLGAALRAELHGDPHEELLLHCSPRRADSPLHPVVSWMRRAARIAMSDAPAVRLARLEALLAPLAQTAEDVALIAEMLPTPTLGRWPVLDLSPRARRVRLLEALLRHVRSLAARRPVLALIEDAHWLDPTTRELLDLLVAETADLALLVLVTHRPEFDASGWIGLPHVTPLQLNRLAHAEHLKLLRRVAGGRKLPAEMEAEILARTDGVPLFVEEVGQAVLESGLLRAEPGRWVLDGRLPRFAVPTGLHASLAARLDRLPSARGVAQAGAVIGREFAHNLLAEVSDLPEGALHEVLDALVAGDLLWRRGEPPDAVYAFKHALVRDAAYGTLLRGRRRELHRRAADAIERLQPEAARHDPELLAHHRAEAGQAEIAAALHLRAAERAAAASAVREARAQLDRGLALLSNVPDARTHRRLEAELRTALGNVAVADAGLGSAETGREFKRAAELCRSLGDDAGLARALWGLWTQRAHAGDLAEALQLAEEAVALAGRSGASERSWRPLAALGATYCFLGRAELARPPLELAFVDPASYGVEAGEMSGGSLAQSMLGRLLAALGKLDLSRVHATEAVERSRRAGHLPSLAHALATGCNQAWLVRDLERLRAWAGELGGLAEAYGYPYSAARAHVYAGWLAVAEDRITEGLRTIAGGLAWLRESGVTLHRPQGAAMLCEAHLLDGSPEAALAEIEEALVVSARTGETWFDAELHRWRAHALLHLGPGEVGRAERALRRALGIGRSQSALLFELRAARDLALMLLDHGGTDEARDLLAPVYNFFTEGFGFPDLAEARALLQEVGEVDAGVTPARPAAASMRDPSP